MFRKQNAFGTVVSISPSRLKSWIALLKANPEFSICSSTLPKTIRSNSEYKSEEISCAGSDISKQRWPAMDFGLSFVINPAY
jgi:hypothetical protein